MHYQIMDYDGNQGRLSIVDCLWTAERLASRVLALRVWETGEVFKPLPEGEVWKWDSPRMTAIIATLKWAPCGRFAEPRKFTVGYQALEGLISVPARKIIDELYDRV